MTAPDARRLSLALSLWQLKLPCTTALTREIVADIMIEELLLSFFVCETTWVFHQH